MEIRKSLEFRQSIAGGTIGGVLIGSVLFLKAWLSPDSFLGWLLFIGTLSVTWLLLISASHWLFRRIENRRLAAGFEHEASKDG
jgi:hypothetical protein